MPSHEEGMGRGGYILSKENSKPDYTIFGTGSELGLAVDVAEALRAKGKDVRVVSMPCWELFEKQDQSYKDSVVGGDLGTRVAIEAGSSLGWHHYVGQNGVTVCMDTFGASAPGNQVGEHFGFTVDAILKRLGV